MENLPTEVLLHLFKNLDEASLIQLESTCQRFSQIVTEGIWAKELELICGTDLALRERFRRWKVREDDGERVRTFYLKMKVDLPLSWKSNRPEVENHLIKRCTSTEFYNEKVTSFALREGNIFVGLQNKIVEVRRVGDGFRLVDRFLDGVDDNDDSPLLQGCQVAASADTVVSTGRRNECLLVWNAKTLSLRGKLHPGGAQNHIYDLGVNSRVIVCLASWSIFAWPHDFSDGFEERPPVVITDFGPSRDFQTWMESHNFRLNEDHVVTHAFRYRSPGDGDDRSERRPTSFLHQRRVTTGPQLLARAAKPIRSCRRAGCEEFEIYCTSLSEGGMLAVLQLERNDAAEVGSYAYVIHVVDIREDVLLHSLPPSSTLFTMVRFPVQWVNSTLYFQMIPKENSDEVVMGSLNMEDRSLDVLDYIVLSNTSDMLHFGRSQVVQIANKYPNAPPPGPKPRNASDREEAADALRTWRRAADQQGSSSVQGFEIHGVIYDYWEDRSNTNYEPDEK